MSIAARIESINNNLKNAYKSLDGLGIDLTNTDKNLENLSSKIDTLYNELPKTTEEGTEITLNDTKKAKMKMILKGNTSQINTTGKNLLKNELISDTVQNITFTNNNNGSIKVNGVAKGILNKKIGSISIQNGETYIISGLPFDSNDSIRIDARPHGVSNQLYNNWTSVNGSYTATEDTVVDIHIRVANGYNCNNIIVWPQVEKGTEATEYESYTGEEPSPNPEYPQDIHVVTGNNTIEVQGKNLLDWNLFEDNNYINVVNKTPRILSITGKTSYYTGICMFLNLKSNTQYVVQALVTAVGTNSQGKLVIYNKNYDASGALSTANRIAASNSLTTEGKISCTFTTDETGIIYVVFQCNNNTNNGSITYEDIQLEEGQVQTNFEPHHHADYPINLGSIELCKIGDYKDILFKNVVGDENYNVELEEGAWYKKSLINKSIFDGSENWAKSSSTANRIFFLQHNLVIRQNYDILCSNFKYNNRLYNTDVVGFDITNISNNWYHLRIGLGLNSDITNANEFKEWLTNNNIILYLVLETPTYEKITNLTLISQLDAVKKAKSNEGQTNIAQTNENLPFIINATALLKND